MPQSRSIPIYILLVFLLWMYAFTIRVFDVTSFHSSSHVWPCSVPLPYYSRPDLQNIIPRQLGPHGPNVAFWLLESLSREKNVAIWLGESSCASNRLPRKILSWKPFFHFWTFRYSFHYFVSEQKNEINCSNKIALLVSGCIIWPVE